MGQKVNPHGFRVGVIKQINQHLAIHWLKTTTSVIL